ncbi:Uncharacterised protein [Metamycoplasma arthritidis]|uniref:Lipoprotein n=1 Tax=Metamycoplasma arthritidis (strain 158L3-1) TaxID=243272 RepID=B3PMV8_META1|nr:hypothetical protein [Metamycoplasma arthritidis]ACF07360.1 hypothetical protein, lipoprotein? [Metamycoplasma arthritidis 158L3-1]VEU78882.1 Uncharacterised protein [Metamycoplasma arthritidis]
MKKSLLLIPILSALTPLPLLVAAKCTPEETQEQKDEKLAKKYEKEYIDKQKYVFDDFEQFKMKPEHFKLEKDNKFWPNAWVDYPNRNIKKYSLTHEFDKDFDKWFKDFQWKFKIFKKVMNKYAYNEVIKYQNPNNGMEPVNLYYVKEVIFDFSQGMNPQNYSLSFYSSGDYKRVFGLFNIPNLNLNLSSAFLDFSYLTSVNFDFNYYSKINITSTYGHFIRKEAFARIREMFWIPKPDYKNEHFATHAAGKSDFEGVDRIPRLQFESYRGLAGTRTNNLLLNLRYKDSFDDGPKNINVDYLKQYGNYSTLKFKSYRVKIIEYDPKKPLDAEPSKVDNFVLSEHGL